MKALILAAGKGSRLVSATEDPKVLLRINGLTTLERISLMCRDARITEIIVVTGYHREQVHAEMRRIMVKYPGITLKEVFNPVFHLNNIVSVACAHAELISDPDGYVHFDGDLIIEAQLLKNLLQKKGNVLVIEDQQQVEQEEMKVRLENGKVVEIDKGIPPAKAAGEYIGMYKLTAKATVAYMQCLQHHILKGETHLYYDNVLVDLLREHSLDVLATHGLKWVEVDVPGDVVKARELFEQQ